MKQKIDAYCLMNVLHIRRRPYQHLVSSKLHNEEDEDTERESHKYWHPTYNIHHTWQYDKGPEKAKPLVK